MISDIRAVVPEHNVRVEYLVFVEDIHDHLLVNMSQQRRSSEFDSTSRLSFEIDSGLLFVQTNPHLVELPLQQFSLQTTELWRC